MATRLVNVRLDEGRVRKARALRARGITLSHVLREAIDAEYAALAATEKPRDVLGALEDILRKHPDPPEAPLRGYDVHEAAQARAAVRERLRRKRR
jgi:hypothetical protein